MEMTTKHLFVYGTLCREGGAHRLLEAAAEFVDRASVSGRLFDLGPFPCMIDGGPNHQGWVRGEVFRITCPKLLDRLDHYEDAGRNQAHLYHRVVRHALTDQGGGLDIWVYLFAGPLPEEAREILSGQWPKR